MNEIYGTGRRKTSSARVFLRPGSGVVTVNGKSIDEYFADDLLKMIVRQPLTLLEKNDAFDVAATVTGGGHSGQAGAIHRHAPEGFTQFTLIRHRQAVVGVGQHPRRRRVGRNDDAMTKAQGCQFPP